MLNKRKLQTADAMLVLTDKTFENAKDSDGKKEVDVTTTGAKAQKTVEPRTAIHILISSST